MNTEQHKIATHIDGMIARRDFMIRAANTTDDPIRESWRRRAIILTRSIMRERAALNDAAWHAEFGSFR